MEWQAGEYFRFERDAQGEVFVGTRNEVLVVALSEAGEVILTIEPSAAFGEQTLILPGGTEEPGEPHEVTADRELQEEVGLHAGRLDFLGALRPFSKYLRLISYVYLARDLSPRKLQGDEAYEIAVERVALEGPDAFDRLIAEGRLVDARVLAALYLTRGFLTTRRD
ncbi:MAG TPA: NUDIX domain-containing protein [Ktedonobacterales bacterium]|jgi:8-oxo-dGTP pyrophosphatase MutT (NUDIX family)|nr:NUDIX domain-containing protein [Ktedonobacterales bacterium]HEX5570650.1 NUDIX domain-containing protein [Ktedonobacterales bacterium]